MRFYVLRKPKPDSPEDRRGRTDAIREEVFNVGDALRCPGCNRFLTSLAWLPPYRIELESWGKNYGDIADIGDEIIVSQHFMEVFAANELKGLLNFAPIDIVKVTHCRGTPSGDLPCYFKATVVRSRTAIDQKASGYVWADESKVCPVCRFDTLKRYQRTVIEDGTWNGDDIFFPRGGNGPLTSERFKVLFQENGLSGAIFVPVEEDRYDFYPWESNVEMQK